MHCANCCRTENTSIPFVLVRYVIGYINSHIQRTLMEHLLNIRTDTDSSVPTPVSTWQALPCPRPSQNKTFVATEYLFVRICC